MYLPSKELLSLVTDIDIRQIIDIRFEDEDIIAIINDYSKYQNDKHNHDYPFNIHTLAHNCKEWAHNSGYIIITYPIGHGEWDAFVVLNGGSNIHKEPLWNSYHEESEPEAIFKASQYILTSLNN